MNRRDTVFALLALSAAPLGSFAQQPSKVWRIGMLETISMAQNAANLNAFLKGMQELGYVEGRNFVIDYRSAGGRTERFAELATELVRGKVDLFVTRGTPATQAARSATDQIPIVTTASSDMVRSGLAKSLSRPGGNVTGLDPFASLLGPKRVELLREVFPDVVRILALINMSNAAAVPAWKETESAARSMGVQVQLFDVRRAEDFERAFEAAVKQRANAIVVGQDGLTQANGKHIVELAAKHRLPAIYPAGDYVEDGGLIGYGVSYPDLYRRAAAYVDKIMKGTKPGDLPIEQPTKFELVINLKTAKQLGLTIPQSVLLRADEMIQ